MPGPQGPHDTRLHTPPLAEGGIVVLDQADAGILERVEAPVLPAPVVDPSRERGTFGRRTLVVEAHQLLLIRGAEVRVAEERAEGSGGDAFVARHAACL